MQGNAGGTYGSWSKVPGECRKFPGEQKEEGAKCHVNAGVQGNGMRV